MTREPAVQDLTKPIRRLVTGTDAQGRSCFVEDGPSRAVKLVADRPGYRVTNIWCTTPGSQVDAPEATAQIAGLLPPKGGTVLRIIDFPAEPADGAARDAALKATFRDLYGDAQHGSDKSAHPGMHETPTVDYALVLAGTIIAIMETGELEMNAGDVLVQRGTMHAWANRSSQPARMAFVLIDPDR
ncbi:cupin domain-containing protein [Reyranella sp. CPCC 100927]|nr:cupin domain-containing protein [Reyranella sp. CPCC 100927]